MSTISREEKACAGLGFSAGAAGIATINGLTTSTVAATGGGMLTTGLANCVAMAPGMAKVALLGGQIISAVPVLVPCAIIGGLAYAGYNFICSELEN